MRTTQDVEDRDANDRLTAELSRQLALGHSTVRLDALARETGLTTRRVEGLMGKYEQLLSSPVERVGGCGEKVKWRLREAEGS